MMTQFDAETVAQFEKETWSRCARTYVAGFGALVSEAIPPLLDKAGVKRGDRVLDLGTGPGLAAAAAAGRGADVVAVDFALPMLAEAHRLYPNLNVREAHAEDLPFADESFDVVVGNFVLHHSGQPQRVLEEAYRVLRSGGRMGFTVWADPAKLEAFGLYFAAVEQHLGAADLPHGPLFGISDFNVFHNMMRKAGFKDSSVAEIDTVWRTPAIEPYLAAFRDWANLSLFPQDKQVAIEESVREGAAAYRSDGGDGFALPNPTILLSAAK